MKPEIFEFNSWISIIEPTRLKIFMREMLEKSGHEIVGFSDHHFSPIGYTAVWIIKESHLAAHTFPEASITYIQLSSCNRDNYEAFVTAIDKFTVQNDCSGN